LSDGSGRSEWERIAAQPDPRPALPPSEPPEAPRERRSLPMGSRAIESVRRARRRRRQIFAAALAFILGVPAVYLGTRALMRGQPPAAARSAVEAAKPPLPLAATAAQPAVAPPRLEVRTDPPGVRVVVDGQPRGVTPLELADLPRGEHQVRLDREGRSVTQAVTLEPARTATLFVPFRTARAAPAGEGAASAGWLTITSPVELNVYEDGDLLGTSRSGRIMVPSGPHTLSLVNEPLGFRTTRDIDVPFGQTATVEVAIPNGRADINAAPWAEVWIDGEKAGETPLAGLTLAAGRHTVTFRHPRLGERSVDCFVTLQEPLRLSADLRK
jgi:hypothetical protein